MDRFVRLADGLEGLPPPRQDDRIPRIRLQGKLETGERVCGAARPQEAEAFRPRGVVMVRVFLEDGREEGEGVVEVALGGEAVGLAGKEFQVVALEDQAILEGAERIGDPAEA